MWWIATRPIAAIAVGGLAWAIPLIVLSGGIDSYLVALGSQAGEDFAWSGMLWTTPTPRRLLFALWETFVLPWDSVPLAIVVGVIALIGVLIALAPSAAGGANPCAGLRDRTLIFHLLFQETVHVRYAMPTLPAMAWLIVCAASVAGRAAPVVSAAIVAAALWFAAPVAIAYGREAHPAFRAIAEMDESRHEQPGAAVFAHFSMLRPLEAASPTGTPMVAVKPRRSREWLDPVGTGVTVGVVRSGFWRIRSARISRSSTRRVVAMSPVIGGVSATISS